MMMRATLLVSASIVLGVSGVEVANHRIVRRSEEDKTASNQQDMRRKEKAEKGESGAPWLFSALTGSPQSAAVSKANVQIGSEQQGNHMSNHNLQFTAWLQTYERPSKTMEVLDVGGGNGDLNSILRAAWPAGSYNYDCLDVHESSQCKQFNGASLPYADGSKDMVVFKYVLHHAGDNTLGLLQDAARVSNGVVVVCEDLKGETETEAKRNYEHEWHGTFRGVNEWEKLFQLLGFRIDKSIPITPVPGTTSDNVEETLGRRMWVLTHGQGRRDESSNNNNNANSWWWWSS